MKKITVAHSIQPYLFQTGSWLYNQIRFSNNIRHVVLTTRKENKKQFPFEPIYSLDDLSNVRQFLEKGYRKLFNQWYPYWLSVCRKEKVDILHSHFGYYGVIDKPLAQKINIPHIVSFYGADMRKALYYNPELKNAYKIMFKNVSAIFVEGLYAKKTIIELGCPEKKIYVSHLGVDLESICSVQRKWKENEFFKILIVGTFTKKKGIIISLKAIDQVIKNNPNLKFEVSLVGDAQQTRESKNTKKEILEFIEKSTLKSVVSFNGYIPYKKVLEMSYDHNLFMQTSIFGDDVDCEGGFPVIITDMMATGMPVLGSKHCDIPEIIKNNNNGFIVKEGNVDDTVEKLLIIIKNYNKYSESFFKYNKTFLYEEFNAKKCSDTREKLYFNLIKKNSYIN